MIIERLRLHNFGIYGGRHVFELAPSADGGKPIILIEGHNGAGKTTFLEAIRLALYGKAALGPRVAQKDYEAHLRDRLHRASHDREMSVALDIRRRESGRERHLEITRRWAVDRHGHGETLSIVENGRLQLGSSADELQDFLNDLVPPGVSQLFFFDGEKIQDMAHGDASAGLQQAIVPLLGLDIVEQLRTDLALFVARQKGDGSARLLQDAERDLTDLEVSLTAAEERRAVLASERDQANARARRAETAFRKEGGLAARDEGDARQEKRAIEDERSHLLTELRELAGGTGPFRLAPQALRRLEADTAAVAIAKAKIAARRMVDEFERQLPGRGSPGEAIWQEFRAYVTDDATTLPAWSNGSIAYLQSRIAAVARFDAGRAVALGEALDRNLLGSQAANDQLEAFRKGLGDDALAAIRAAEFARGRADAALNEQDAKVVKLRSQRDDAKHRRSRLNDEQFEAERLSRGAALASKARAALIAYEERILAGRVAALEAQVLACLHRLLRRPTMIGRVAFEADTFNVELRDGDDTPIALDSLSAGERQLFAVAVLWALAKVSERALPLVIDTPLGRLDRLHRQRIIDQYLAGASEQVVLLCTDTELTDDIASQLRPFVSRRLTIGIDGPAPYTQIAADSDIEVEAPARAAG